MGVIFLIRFENVTKIYKGENEVVALKTLTSLLMMERSLALSDFPVPENQLWYAALISSKHQMKEECL